jgi:hypothetical protein
MIVLGADTHKRSHTIAAVAAMTGELLGEQTAQAGAKGSAALLGWAPGLGAERVWALEDCRHVSGSLERFLIERGERVPEAEAQFGYVRLTHGPAGVVSVILPSQVFEPQQPRRIPAQANSSAARTTGAATVS